MGADGMIGSSPCHCPSRRSRSRSQISTSARRIVSHATHNHAASPQPEMYSPGTEVAHDDDPLQSTHPRATSADRMDVFLLLVHPGARRRFATPNRNDAVHTDAPDGKEAILSSLETALHELDACDLWASSQPTTIVLHSDDTSFERNECISHEATCIWRQPPGAANLLDGDAQAYAASNSEQAADASMPSPEPTAARAVQSMRFGRGCVDRTPEEIAAGLQASKHGRAAPVKPHPTAKQEKTDSGFTPPAPQPQTCSAQTNGHSAASSHISPSSASVIDPASYASSREATDKIGKPLWRQSYLAVVTSVGLRDVMLRIHIQLFRPRWGGRRM